jgi:hypothetical protein
MLFEWLCLLALLVHTSHALRPCHSSHHSLGLTPAVWSFGQQCVSGSIVRGMSPCMTVAVQADARQAHAGRLPVSTSVLRGGEHIRGPPLVDNKNPEVCQNGDNRQPRVDGHVRNLLGDAFWRGNNAEGDDTEQGERGRACAVPAECWRAQVRYIAFSQHEMVA